MPIRKRRPQKTVNKNQERLMRREGLERQMQNAGSLLSRFPTVSRLDIQMEFVSSQGHVLSSEQRSFQANDALDFSVPCQGRCGNGRMDMESVISQMIGAQQTTRATKGMCREILFPGSNDTCNCELRCQITVEYQNIPDPANA